MADTGKGNPLRSGWLASPSQLRRGIRPADADDAELAVWSDWFFAPANHILVQPAAAVATVDTATATVVAQDYKFITPAAAAITVATATPVVGTSGVSTLVVYAERSSGALYESGSPVVVTFDSPSGYVSGSGPTYAAARGGTGSVGAVVWPESGTGAAQLLSAGTYYFTEGFLWFDTSDIPEGALILAASISFVRTTGIDAPSVVQVRAYDFGDTLTADDFVPGDSLSALPLCAHVPAGTWAGAFNIPPYWTPAVTDDLASHIVAGGTSRFVLSTDRMAAGTAPSDATELLGLEYVDEGQVSGDVPLRARLDVVYADPEAGSTGMDSYDLIAPYPGNGFQAATPFLAFDCSSLAGATVSDAVLTVYSGYAIGDGQLGVGDLPVEVRSLDWGAEIDLSDWPANWPDLPLLAHGTIPFDDAFEATVDFALTSDALAASIDPSGTIRMAAAIDWEGRGVGLLGWYDAADPENIIDLRPYLTIEYTAAGGADTLVQPAAAAVTIGTATATVVAQNWPHISPAAAAVTVGTATPAVVAQNWPRVQPAAAAVTIGTATPAVVGQDYILRQPAAAAVAVAGATTAVAAHRLVQPSAAAVTVAGVIPAIGTPVSVSPAAAALSIAGATPALVAEDYILVQPAAAAVTLATATPAIVAEDFILLQPAAAEITITTATPAVNAVATTVVQPAAAAVTIATATPALAATQTYTPAAAAVSLAGATPAVVAWAIVQPAAAAVSVTGVAPTVAAHRLVQPVAAAVAITGATAAIAALQTYHPAAAALTVTTATPAVSAVMTTVVGPAAAIVAIGTATPAVTATQNAVVQPAAAALEFAGVAADVIATENVILFPGPLGLVIDTATPLVLLPKRPLGLAASMRLAEIPVRSQISASYDTQIADGRLAA